MQGLAAFMVIGLLVGLPLSLGTGQGAAQTEIRIDDREQAAADAQGVTRAWVRRYRGPGLNSQAVALALDSLGNIYVTGSSQGDGTGYDFVTIKYDPNDDKQWVRRYNGPANGNGYATAIAVDSQGNAYVTGSSETAPGHYDIVTIKYAPSP